MNLESFTGEGSTPSRRRFWDKVTAAVIASQKVAGKNVSVSEHHAMGTLVNVAHGQPTGCPTSITFNGVEFCCACVDDTGSRVEFFEDPDLGVINDVPFSPFTQNNVCDPFICINNSSLSLPFRLSLVDFICPTGIEDPGVLPFTISARLVSGIWHVGVGITDSSGLVVFYGFGSNPSSITNSLTDCTLTQSTFDNALTQCFGEPIVACSVGKNGTASLTF